MLARTLLIGVLALATLPHSPGPQTSPTALRILLRVENPSDDIAALSVVEAVHPNGAPRTLSVELQGQVMRVGQQSKLAGMTIQVWLLRADGTTVAQGKCSGCDSFTSTPPVDHRQFTFAPVPAKELAGVVVSLNGKLFVREIKVTSTP